MKIAVIGLGAIGGILSAHLAKAGEEVFVVDVDQEILSAAKNGGLEIEGPAVDKIAGNFSVKMAGVGKDLSEFGSLDLVFVCVKTTAQSVVAAALKKTWRNGTKLISFQNGIDSEEPLAAIAGRDNTLRVVIYYAGRMIKPCNYSVSWFNSSNCIGALTKNGKRHADAVAQILSRAGLVTEVVEDIKKAAFQKTALNSSLSPACALTGLTMGGAMAVPEVRKLVIEILKEAFLVAGKMGWQFEKTIDDWLKYLEAGGAHRTSMAEDVEVGRQTEIMFMNGKICEYGEKLGVPTPYNNAMLWTIIGREQCRKK